MVHTANNLSTSISIQSCFFHTFGQTAGTTKKVYYEQFDIGQTF